MELTLCNSDECLLKENCKRYLGSPSKHQSYFSVSPYVKEFAYCSYFLKQGYIKGEDDNQN